MCYNTITAFERIFATQSNSLPNPVETNSYLDYTDRDDVLSQQTWSKWKAGQHPCKTRKAWTGNSTSNRGTSSRGARHSGTPEFLCQWRTD